jgi:hypothetical protein
MMYWMKPTNSGLKPPLQTGSPLSIKRLLLRLTLTLELLNQMQGEAEHAAEGQHEAEQ